MHELLCLSCNAPAQYDLKDYLLLCPFCSATFHFDIETGKKELFTDHFIVPNTSDSRQIKTLVMEWLKRLHHSAAIAEKEYFIVEINGMSVPYWIVSLEAHTVWKGLVGRRNFAGQSDGSGGSGYISENGHFRRNFRWAVTARDNLYEHWGFIRLHEPQENVIVDWDGFPLDSTFSRGRIDENMGVKAIRNNRQEDLSAYEVREFFEFKFANGLPILGIQIQEEDALRRARNHVERYHYEISKTYVDLLTEVRTELEIAGIQLVHLPFWHVKYVYKPSNFLRHFTKQRERNVLVEGYAGGVLKGELAIVQQDKLYVNAMVTGVSTLLLFFLGVLWHTAFTYAAVFTLIVTIASIYLAVLKKSKAAHDKFIKASEAI